MRILGISFGHDSNYCLMEDGKIIVHNELERFTRKKHDWECTDLMNLIKSQGHLTNIDYIVTPILYMNFNLGHEILSEYSNVIHVGHHTCHASSAYYNSNFENSIIFTVDGGGFEPESFFTTAAVFNGNKNKLDTIYKNYSFDLGHYWLYMLESLGMSTVFTDQGDQSGTLMAMAAYGNPFKYLEYFDDISYCTKSDWNDSKRESFAKIINLNSDAKFDLAASLQYVTEEFLKNFIFSHICQSSSKNICFSGGTMLNCVFLGKIGKILKKRGYNVFCDQAPNDSGISLGAVKYYYYNVLGNERQHEKHHSYLGKTYCSDEIISTIKTYNTLHVTNEVSLEKIVELLMSGKIISVFNEGSESGKRALGNRSIIADPRFSFMKDFINEKVKHRKNFRPFAPSVLREEVNNWFEYDIDSPYMSFAVKVKEDKRHLVPAILHQDNTARLQTVTKKDNGYYHDLIKLFYVKTGVPMILNTSFNDREPIVETPNNAIDCFLRTKIDYLYFVKEKILVRKS